MSSNRILVIEDDKDLAFQLVMRLEAEGYEVTVAHDGSLGLELARDSKPDIILLDLMLPELDGYRLCRLLKFDRKYESIPIIVITARSMEQDRLLAAETGANAYFVKPVKWQELTRTIDLLVKHPERSQSVKPLYQEEHRNGQSAS